MSAAMVFFYFISPLQVFTNMSEHNSQFNYDNRHNSDPPLLYSLDESTQFPISNANHSEEKQKQKQECINWDNSKPYWQFINQKLEKVMQLQKFSITEPFDFFKEMEGELRWNWAKQGIYNHFWGSQSSVSACWMHEEPLNFIFRCIKCEALHLIHQFNYQTHGKQSENIKNLWIRWGIWNFKWEDMLGLLWKHKQSH